MGEEPVLVEYTLSVHRLRGDFECRLKCSLKGFLDCGDLEVINLYLRNCIQWELDPESITKLLLNDYISKCFQSMENYLKRQNIHFSNLIRILNSKESL